MVNPDGRLWIEHAPEPAAVDTAERIGTRRGRAHHPPGRRARAPRGARPRPHRLRRAAGDAASASRASMPPVSLAPLLCRSANRPNVLYRLARLRVSAHHVGAAGRGAGKHAVRERKNILVVGGTSSGKTTLVNALLAEIADAGERVVILEDTRELQVRRRGLRRPAHQARRAPALPTWCARPCACAPTASSSAKCAVPKPSTCSRPGTPATPAASPPCTPTRAASGPLPLGAADPGSGRHRAPRPHRPGHRHRRLPRRSRQQPPRRNAWLEVSGLDADGNYVLKPSSRPARPA